MLDLVSVFANVCGCGEVLVGKSRPEVQHFKGYDFCSLSFLFFFLFQKGMNEKRVAK